MKGILVRPALAGTAIGALAITEPDGGSDVAGLRTTAVRDGDSYVINGAKTYITSGCRADFAVTAVRTGGPGAPGVSLLVIERALSVEHLFSVIVSEFHDCRDAAAVARLRARLQAGEDVEALSAEEVRQRVFGQWQTHHWFQRALAACSAPRLLCRHEELFLRGVAGLAAVDEMFAFAGLAPRNALVDDASLLRFLWAGQHYTAGLVAYSPALRALRAVIETELARLRQERQAQPAGDADAGS